MIKKKLAIVLVAGVAVLGVASTVMARQAGKGHGSHGFPPVSFSELDTNANGSVTQEEMQAHAKARFLEADTSGDGLLSKDEMIARGAQRAAEKRSERLTRMMGKRDANNDGLLSFEELSGNRDGSRFFKRLDANNDGSVSAAEYTKLETMGRRGSHGGYGGKPIATE